MKQMVMFDGISLSRTTQRERELKSFCLKFQRWSDKQKDNESTHYGKCGYMRCCDYCEDVGAKNPCAKAMRKFLKLKKVDWSVYKALIDVIDLSQPFEKIIEDLDI